MIFCNEILYQLINNNIVEDLTVPKSNLYDLFFCNFTYTKDYFQFEHELLEYNFLNFESQILSNVSYYIIQVIKVLLQSIEDFLYFGI